MEFTRFRVSIVASCEDWFEEVETLEPFWRRIRVSFTKNQQSEGIFRTYKLIMAIKMDINYFGEWSQNVVIGLLTGLISGIFVALLFIFPNNPSMVSPYLLAFTLMIAVFLVANVIIQSYREKVNRTKGVSTPEIIPTPPTNENLSLPIPGITKSDIESFCKSVIAWKVSATEKDEIFQLFKDNPYYLMGYLAYITKVNIDETKALQKKIIAFTLVSLIIAMGSMVFTGYSINPVFFIPGLGVYAMVLFGVWYVLKKSK